MILRFIKALTAFVATFIACLIWDHLPNIYGRTVEWDSILRNAQDPVSLGIGFFCGAMVFVLVLIDPKRLGHWIKTHLDYPWW